MEAQNELEIIKKLEEERKISDMSYAPMIVKVIVYAFIGLICVAFITFLTAKVWPQ
jgi:hypothetical protein